jgi:hypothetical protein
MQSQNDVKNSFDTSETSPALTLRASINTWHVAEYAISIPSDCDG